MGIMKAFAEDLAEAMGFLDINQTVLEVGQSILDTKQLPMSQRGLQVARIACKIRKERYIRFCAWCSSWWDGEDWVRKALPKYTEGHITHSICPKCYDEMKKES